MSSDYEDRLVALVRKYHDMPLDHGPSTDRINARKEMKKLLECDHYVVVYKGVSYHCELRPDGHYSLMISEVLSADPKEV